jgi:phosphoribosylaminoimidazolecarboxamide formyltransferase/IMP cyclohydrolase
MGGTPRRAVISVSDKRGAAELVAALVKAGWEVLSTGGTAAVLRAAGLSVTEVSDYTGQPEMMGGRVKTLHPKLLGGILARRGAHEPEMEAHGLAPIDLVAVNLYPFRETAARPDAALAEAVDQIDVGGPTLVRSAAKNFEAVTVLVDPDDYPFVIARLEAGEEIPPETRRRLAQKAFRHTASYDAAISGYLTRREASGGEGEEGFPARLALKIERAQTLRYGENPHQRGALYRLSAAAEASLSLPDAEVLGGKALSFNNLLDLAAAAELAAEMEGTACAIIKHTNPSGVGLGESPTRAYGRALACDPASAFGSVISFNRRVDAATAEAMRELFVEAVIAPGFEEEALSRFRKKKSLRILRLEGLGERSPGGYDLRSVPGGVLLQDRDQIAPGEMDWKVVTPRRPDAAEEKALRLAWRVARHVKSNAIVLAGAEGTVGIGAGQMSRVDAVRLAAGRAVLPVAGAALGSDAFFPFRDGVDEAAKSRVRAIAQPGGSVRDAEVIQAAAEHDIAMVFTGVRHFRH